MASPAPKSPEQSDKSKKYDRQLRLWGDHGQIALESANVCLVHATGLGCEILKSLILPGIRSFTIVDGKKVQSDDIESNFFLDNDSIGKPRAEVATQLLVDLNPDVHGDYLEEDIGHVLQHNPGFFSSFTVVIGTSLSEKTLVQLANALWSADIPFLVCKSFGFLGYIRIQVKEHTVIESHPDSKKPDLRLDRPFPELLSYINQVNLEEMTLKDHAHIPYVVILYKALKMWQETTGEQFPKSWKDKEALRNIIRNNILKNEDGVPLDEENFEEAIRAVNSSLNVTSIPSHVKAILDDGACINLTAKSKPFWILSKALRDFVENEGDGCLPVSGSLPDMTAETSRYVALQQLYHGQARKNAFGVYRRAQQILHELNQPAETISEEDARLFCKHSSDLHLVRGSAIQDEYNGKNQNLQNLGVPEEYVGFVEGIVSVWKAYLDAGEQILYGPCSALEADPYILSELDPPGSLVLYYVLLRGVERFHSEYTCFPGELDDHVEPDIVQLKVCIGKLLSEWGWGPIAKDDYVHEISRYGGCELHSVSAFIGGCAAQEIIKLITCQYKPIHNTFIYDAMTSTTATFSL